MALYEKVILPHSDASGTQFGDDTYGVGSDATELMTGKPKLRTEHRSTQIAFRLGLPNNTVITRAKLRVMPSRTEVANGGAQFAVNLFELDGFWDDTTKNYCAPVTEQGLFARLTDDGDLVGTNELAFVGSERMRRFGPDIFRTTGFEPTWNYGNAVTPLFFPGAVTSIHLPLLRGSGAPPDPARLFHIEVWTLTGTAVPYDVGVKIAETASVDVLTLATAPIPPAAQMPPFLEFPLLAGGFATSAAESGGPLGQPVLVRLVPEWTDGVGVLVHWYGVERDANAEPGAFGQMYVFPDTLEVGFVEHRYASSASAPRQLEAFSGEYADDGFGNQMQTTGTDITFTEGEERVFGDSDYNPSSGCAFATGKPLSAHLQVWVNTRSRYDITEGRDLVALALECLEPAAEEIYDYDSAEGMDPPQLIIEYELPPDIRFGGIETAPLVQAEVEVGEVIQCGELEVSQAIDADVDMVGAVVDAGLEAAAVVTAELEADEVLQTEVEAGETIIADVETGAAVEGADLETGEVIEGDVSTDEVVSGDVEAEPVVSSDIETGEQ